MNEDTICAIATAQGGALGIIRVSGPKAIPLTSSIFRPFRASKQLEKTLPYTLTFGYIVEGDEVVDEVLVSVFHEPHSYTGEDSTEITCHGSPYILHRTLQLLIDHGARLAQPGEYTRRAFIHNKMDLSQAEAVADLIASTSQAQHRLAMNQMRGGFSKELRTLRNKLLQITSLIELELDFTDHEELEFADRSQLTALASEIEHTITRLTHSFKLGNVLKNGIPVAIIGETNAGKSTLLNALLNEDKAIVSDIHGTTRDIIEDIVNIQGINFRFIDTAGIRQTHDTIEALGIERSFRAMEQAQIIIIVCDINEDEERFRAFYTQILPHLADKQVLLLFNKCDTAYTPHFTPPKGISSLTLSAKQGTHLDRLQSLLVEAAGLSGTNQGDIIVTNIRHYEALTRALNALHCVQAGLSEELPSDLIAQDLRECIFHLSDIIGEVTTDEVLGNIFRNFCVGK